jgi:hypothetical protein
MLLAFMSLHFTILHSHLVNLKFSDMEEVGDFSLAEMLSEVLRS